MKESITRYVSSIHTETPPATVEPVITGFEYLIDVNGIDIEQIYD